MRTDIQTVLSILTVFSILTVCAILVATIEALIVDSQLRFGAQVTLTLKAYSDIVQHVKHGRSSLALVHRVQALMTHLRIAVKTLVEYGPTVDC